MKNIYETDRKTAICLSLWRFSKIIDEISSGKIAVDYDYEYGLAYTPTEKTNTNDTDIVVNIDAFIIAKLSDYFDAKIISLHSTNDDPLSSVSVWIEYKDNRERTHSDELQ